MEKPTEVFSDMLEVDVYHDKSYGPARRNNFLGRLQSSHFVKKGEEALIYYPLEKRSLLSWIQGEIGLKIYYVDAVPAPPVAPPEKDPPVPEIEVAPQPPAPENAVPEGEKKPQPDSSAPPPPPQEEQPPEAKDQEPPKNAQEQDPPQPVKEQSDIEFNLSGSKWGPWETPSNLKLDFFFLDFVWFTLCKFKKIGL
ncbi:protein QUIRKY-like [Pistacia vera]|uniref:protein QUIRKY-like n=1 Tax=Pistacia vera TaxID=55513 RepID=UPI001263003A|nr:protein QUIRKY-like [Pistacia vera]